MAAPLTFPQAGYLDLTPRLAAGLALLVPLTWAPLVMVIAGLFAQALPVPILLSARSRNWASLPTRMLLAALYVALPNAREIHLVATNSQWHMALTAALTAFACSPLTWRGRLFDIVVLTVAASPDRSVSFLRRWSCSSGGRGVSPGAWWFSRW